MTRPRLRLIAADDPEPRPVNNAPAADFAHLCTHAPAAPEDTQGCPNWPACLQVGPPPAAEPRRGIVRNRGAFLSAALHTLKGNRG